MLERKPEPVRPMEQRKHTDAEQHKFRERIPHGCKQMRMVGRIEPPERKRQPEKQQQNGQNERGRHAPSAEQQPEEGLS